VKTPPDLQAQLEALPSLSRVELLERFDKEYGRPAPPRLSNKILALAVAYRMQEKVFGGLKPEIRRFLLSEKPIAMPTKAAPGTILIREWQGREHTVMVFPDGVEYGGERYRSLTDVAYRITGQKRSGPAFFGLKKP